MASNSTSLSEADALLLRDYAVLTTQEVLGILFEGVFVGVYTIFFGLAVYSIQRRGFKSRRAVVLSVVVCYLYATSLAAWGVDCYITFKNIHSLYMTVDILPLPDREDLEIATFNQFVGVVELFFVFSAIVADAVVVWRTWAVYAGRLTAIAAPCLLLLAAFVFALVDVTLSLDKGADSPLPGADIMYTKSQILVWALSLATNVLCTVLIGIRAWRHRRTMKELSLGVKYPGLSTDRILSLLVESGFIYSFLWAAQVVGYLDFSADSPWNYISQVVVRIGRQLTGLYPTLIIVLVNFGHTIWESEGYHTEALGRDRKMGSLRWAPMTTTTTSSVPTRRGKHDELGIGLESVMSRGDADEARGAEDG